MLDRITYVIRGDPRTKKNSQKICRGKGGRPFVKPSNAYEAYENMALWQLRPRPETPIDSPVNVQVVYHMKTRRRVDLNNLLEATCDILVKAGILADDNSQIVASHDGSRVVLGCKEPRAEITIEPMERLLSDFGYEPDGEVEKSGNA